MYILHINSKKYQGNRYLRAGYHKHADDFRKKNDGSLIQKKSLN